MQCTPEAARLHATKPAYGLNTCTCLIKTALVDEGGLLYWQHGAVLPMALSALLSDAAFYSLNCDTSVRRSPPRRDRS